MELPALDNEYAARLREEADRQLEEELTAVAGSGYRPMLALIDEYERVLDEQGDDAAEQVMDQIRELLDGGLDGLSGSTLHFRPEFGLVT